MAWIHDLARAEVNPLADQLSLGQSFDPQQLVEESTVSFMDEIRDVFQEYAKVFNGYSESGARYPEVKVYGLANGASDFMVFRNQIKFLVSNVAHGVVQLSFVRHIRSDLTVNGLSAGGPSAETQPSQALGSPKELRAQIGPFQDVFWTFEGEKIEAAQVAKFFFVEFIRASREVKKPQHSNQVLIDQIKNLLQERGLDL